MGKKEKWDLPSSIFLGCLFLGTGIGMLNNETAIGSLFGLGAGFILAGIAKAKYKK